MCATTTPARDLDLAKSECSVVSVKNNQVLPLSTRHALPCIFLPLRVQDCRLVRVRDPLRRFFSLGGHIFPWTVDEEEGHADARHQAGVGRDLRVPGADSPGGPGS